MQDGLPVSVDAGEDDDEKIQPAFEMKTLPPTFVMSGLITLMACGNLLEPAALGQTTAPPHRPASSKLEAPAGFEKTLRLFLALAAEDQTLRSLLAKHRLTLQYGIRDIGLDCFVGFNGSNVVATIGRCAKPDICLVSDAATLDQALRSGKSQSQMQVTTHMGLVRKFKLSKDLDAILGALSRAYVLAGQKAQMEPTALAQR
jgi:hypothetical protein